MSTSDTPLTDAVAEYTGSNIDQVAMMTDLARSLERQLAAAQQQSRELQADRERLDWLEDKLCYPMVCLNGHSMEMLKNNGRGWHNGELRAAIDAARKENNKVRDARAESGASPSVEAPAE